MSDRERKPDEPKPKTRRVKLADVIAAGLERLGGVLRWELRKRRGKPELYVTEVDDNLTREKSPP